MKEKSNAAWSWAIVSKIEYNSNIQRKGVNKSMQIPGGKKTSSGYYSPLFKQVQFDFYNDGNSNVFHFLILSMISHPAE